MSKPEFNLVNGKIINLSSIEAVTYSYRDLTQDYEIVVHTAHNQYIIGRRDTQERAIAVINDIYQELIRED